MDKGKDVIAMRDSYRAGRSRPSTAIRTGGRASLLRGTGPRRALRNLIGTEGAQLYEFALALPLLIIMTVGVMDFAIAYNVKQKLTNAAREGARLAASQSQADLTQTTPASVEVIKEAVDTYLANANVDTSFIGSGMTPVGSFTWTYFSAPGPPPVGLEIQRAVAVPATGGGVIMSTQVNLTYSYNWTFGFDSILNLLFPGATWGTIIISTGAVMPNLS